MAEVNNWATAWAIVGPSLPHDAVKIAHGVALLRLDDKTYVDWKNFRAPVSTFKVPNETFVRRLPPVTHVQSRYSLQIAVQASDHDDAVLKATPIANATLASLSLATGGKFYAELRIVREWSKQQEESAFSEAVQFIVFDEPEPIRAEKLDNALGIYRALVDSPKAADAATFLQTAWQLQQTAGSKPLQKSILLQYVLCIEAITKSMLAMYKFERTKQTRADQISFAEDFAAKLALQPDKVKAIREASTGLRMIAIENMKPAIAYAAKQLSISDEITLQAQNLYEFRSGSIGHPGKADPAKIERWLAPSKKNDAGIDLADTCLADDVASTFLRKFCEHIASK